jgi:hypothetical protein
MESLTTHLSHLYNCDQDVKGVLPEITHAILLAPAFALGGGRTHFSSINIFVALSNAVSSSPSPFEQETWTLFGRGLNRSPTTLLGGREEVEPLR